MRMLFVPGELTAREHCYDRVEPLKKHPANPVLVPEHEWEGTYPAYPCVLYSEKDRLFKMWYGTSVGTFGKHKPLQPLIDNFELNGQFFLCYAESRDGLQWEKPALGKVKIKGSADNNIVLSDSGFFLGLATVIEDADDPDPNRRYKLLIYDNDGEGRDGARTAVSPNGIDWQFTGPFPVLPTQDTPSLWHDRRRGQYVAFLKARIDGRRARMISVSRDFSTWSPPSVLLTPDQADSPTLHLYHQSAFEDGGHAFGFLGRFEFATQKLDAELIVSHRGTDWVRLPSRPQVLATGDPQDWDGGMITQGPSEPIVRGESRWSYYNGTAARHDQGEGRGAIGIATFVAGRLVGQQFEGEGWFQTLPFLCPGGVLSLDAVANEPLTVEVHGAGYLGALQGYGRSECQSTQGDRRDHAIRWTEKANLDGLHGQYISLRIYGKNSIVYGATIA